MKPKTFTYFTVSKKLQKAVDEGMALAELQLLGLSVRTINTLEDHKCVYVRDLLKYTKEKVKAMKNMGDFALLEIERSFSNFDLLDKKNKQLTKTTSKIENYQEKLNSRVYLD